MKQPRLSLEPGETVRGSWLANHTQHSQRAVSGRLFLTDRRLIFEPHAFEAAVSGKTWAVSLQAITGIDRIGVNLRHFFGGGLRPCDGDDRGGHGDTVVKR